MPIDNEQTFASEPVLRYYLQEAESANPWLFVGFSAFPAAGKPPSYNYVRVMRSFPVPCLWILDEHGPSISGAPVGCYYLGRDRSLDVANACASLIAATADRLGITRKHIVSFGSSKGATAALWFALRHHYGHAIAGGPQVLLGDYLIDQYPPYRRVAEYIAGGIDTESRDYLNQLLGAALRDGGSATRPLLHVHVGAGDPHWPRHVQPFMETAAAVCASTELDLTEYGSHGDLGTFFPGYLARTVAELIGAAR